MNFCFEYYVQCSPPDAPLRGIIPIHFHLKLSFWEHTCRLCHHSPYVNRYTTLSWYGCVAFMRPPTFHSSAQNFWDRVQELGWLIGVTSQGSYGYEWCHRVGVGIIVPAWRLLKMGWNPNIWQPWFNIYCGRQHVWASLTSPARGDEQGGTTV